MFLVKLFNLSRYKHVFLLLQIQRKEDLIVAL